MSLSDYPCKRYKYKFLLRQVLKMIVFNCSRSVFRVA